MKKLKQKVQDNLVDISHVLQQLEGRRSKVATFEAC